MRIIAHEPGQRPRKSNVRPGGQASNPITATLFAGAKRPTPVDTWQGDWGGFLGLLRRELARETPVPPGPKHGRLDRMQAVKTRMRGLVAAPFAGRRNDSNVGPHTVLALDVDRIPASSWDDFWSRAERYQLAVHHSPRSCAWLGAEGMRWRVWAALAEPIAPEHVPAARRALARDLGLDPARCGIDEAKAASQLMFVGRFAGTHTRWLQAFDGEPWRFDANTREAAAPEADSEREAQVSALHDHTPDLSALAEIIPYGDECGRHELSRGLGGWLGRRGYAPDAIAASVLRLISESGDSIPQHRAEQAQDAAEQARRGEITSGWGQLDQWAKRWCEPAAARELLARLEADNPDPNAEQMRGIIARQQARRAANDTNDDYAGRDAAVDNVIQSISAPACGVYQRSGMLCTIVREAHDDGKMIRPAGAPMIRTLPPARLKELISKVCGPRDANLSQFVAARGEWDHIRPLDAVASYPIMRRDGTLLLENGYDAATRTLAEINVSVNVPSNPTHADAKRALGTLEDLVCDFPFADDSQRAAWLAMLLTVPARPAIDGPTPLGLLEASQRGSGKSLLADLIAVITTGEPASRCVAPKTKEEWDKSICTILLAGDALVLIDNVTHMLVSDALDAVLTGTTFQQRLLGGNERARLAIRTVFLASANNARLSTDLVRRSLGCRLEPDVERPEARTGFRHADLPGHARAHREELLGAALTILRAYAVAGRPRVEARPMGSYQAWCRTVRDALVWAGAADPAVTQDALRETADVERDELRDLLTAWHAVLGDRAVTVRELIDATSGEGSPDRRAALLDALEGIMPGGREIKAHAIGNRLRTLRGNIVGGLSLQEGRRARGDRATYRVERR